MKKDMLWRIGKKSVESVLKKKKKEEEEKATEERINK